MSAEISSVLNRAADLIETGEWGQGSAHLRSGTLCARQAIAAASPDIQRGLAASCFFANHLGVEFIAQWNDRPGRTKAEVVSALRDAAAS